MTATITLEQLQAHWPHGDSSVPGLLEGIAASAPAVFAKYGINTQLTVAMMFGQFSEETGGGVDMIEDIRYTPARACQLWPSRFNSVTSVYAVIGSYVGDPQFDIKLMDNVYGNRMGNRPNTHDGSTYIGRGLSQCTGRGVESPPSGYIGVGLKTGLDVLDHPEILTAPATALECAVADFILCGCLPFAETGDIFNVTRHLNGGLIGINDREVWTSAWRREFGV
jgi:putative chitinase